jgi:hypothetical protein
MRNNRYGGGNSKYSLEGFPPNYSGQLREDPPPEKEEADSAQHAPQNLHKEIKEQKEPKEEAPGPAEKSEKKEGSLLGNLFKGGKDGKDGKKGGFLSGLFGKNEGKGGGLFSNLELEDMILIGVIFFLLKDGIEDDLIIIIAIILFMS